MNGAVSVSAVSAGYSNETGHIRVTVRIYPGDQFVIPTNTDGSFDFGHAAYTPAKH